MGMIRRADLEQLRRDALVMNLEDLRSHGESIIADATRRAEQIIKEADRERERRIASAHDDGFAKGHAEGLEAGRAEGTAIGSAEAKAQEAESIRVLIEGWDAALDDFEARREQLLREARTEVVRLAAEIATRVVRRVVDIDPRAVEPQMNAVLSAVARPTRLTVRVHPDDLDCAQRALPAMLERFELCTHADLVTDASIGRGSVVAATEGGGRIDASVQGQLDRIIAEVLPDEPELLGGKARATEERGGQSGTQSDAA